MSNPPMPMVQVFAPDGTLGDVPYDKLHDALGAGAKIAAKVKAPDGTMGFVPGDRVPDALKAGGQRVPLDLNDADGGKPGFWSRATGLKPGATSDQFLDKMGQDNVAAAKFGAESLAGTTVAGPAAKLFNADVLPALKSVPFIGKAVSAIDEAPGVIGKVVRGATVGGTSGGVEAAIRGKNPGEIAKEAGEGALVGGALGATIPLAERLSPASAETVAQRQLTSDAAAMRTRNLQASVAESKAADAAGQTVQEYRAAQKATAKADTAARQPVPLTDSPNYQKWKADQADAAQAAKDAARADAAARQPVPVSQSPYYGQNQAAAAAEEAARKPVPLNQSPYYTQNQEAAADAARPAQPLRSIYGPPVPSAEDVQGAQPPSSLPTPRTVAPTSEGRPATWTNDVVRERAAWGDPDAVDQARARGFGRVPLNYSTVETTPRSKTTFDAQGNAIPSGGTAPMADVLAKSAPEPNFAYRVRNQGEEGVPIGGSKNNAAHATTTLEDAQRLAPGRGSVEGEPQEIVKYDLSKLKEGKDYERVPREGQPDWIRMLRPLKENEVQPVTTQ